MVAYSEQLRDSCVTEVRSAERDAEEDDLADAMLGAVGDVANVGFDALSSIAKGGAGILRHTVKGAKAGGLSGAAKGLGIGAIGAVATTALAARAAVNDTVSVVATTAESVDKSATNKFKSAGLAAIMAGEGFTALGACFGSAQEPRREKNSCPPP